MSDKAEDERGDGHATDPILTPELRQEFERGLRFAHVMLSVTQDQGNEAVAYVQALAEVLAEKGLISEEEIEGPLERARQEIAQLMMPRVRLADMGDKYAEGQAVEVDCLSRLPLCHGRCCTFRFFLTKQDLDEGVARWDYGNPYWIRQGADGHCVHSDPITRVCTIHAQRPHICRKYDCRNDKRIWIDFEKRIPAPPSDPSGEAPVAMAEIALQNSMKGAEE
ncbi:MAG: YkgJ family cysteine cluster protein [Anaerolineae bacterium]|nr:YkgJ family cysteine cluster protein [Anaerolineae bacterium]